MPNVNASSPQPASPRAEPPGRAAAAHSALRRDELRQTVRLAIPVTLVQVGFMTMGAVDTLMVGHVSARALAAVALGNLYFFNVTIFAMGTLMALDPIVAQAVGAGDQPAVRRGVQRGLLLAGALTVFTALLLLPAPQIFAAVRQPPEIRGDASAYAHISIAGVLPFLVFIVLRQTLQAIGRVRPIVWAMAGANVLNVGLNWVFIYGNLGVPPLGPIGSAIATALSRWIMLIGLAVAAFSVIRGLVSPAEPGFGARGPLWRVLKLGSPIGAQMTLEAGAFGAIGLLMGVLGTREMAAHQIAITLAALTFMVPLGVSAAAAVRVGHAVGAGDAPRARAAARAAYLCGVGFMTLTAMVFLGLPGPLAQMFTRDASVVALAGVLIPIAGVFQVFDGGQAVGAGILRGMGDTRAPLVAMLAGYWLIGVPISWYLGFHTALRAAGLWWGFVASLLAVAVFLLWRVRVLFRRELRRVEIDRAH